MPTPSVSHIGVFSFTTAVHVGPKTDERKRVSEREQEKSINLQTKTRDG